MENASLAQTRKPAVHPALPAVGAVILAVAFAALVVISDQVWLPWMKTIFSTAVPNLWGLVSRGYMLLLGILVIAVWRNPAIYGFHKWSFFSKRTEDQFR